MNLSNQYIKGEEFMEKNAIYFNFLNKLYLFCCCLFNRRESNQNAARNDQFTKLNTFEEERN